MRYGRKKGLNYLNDILLLNILIIYSIKINWDECIECILIYKIALILYYINAWINNCNINLHMFKCINFLLFNWWGCLVSNIHDLEIIVACKLCTYYLVHIYFYLEKIIFFIQPPLYWNIGCCCCFICH